MNFESMVLIDDDDQIYDTVMFNGNRNTTMEISNDIDRFNQIEDKVEV